MVINRANINPFFTLAEFSTLLAGVVGRRLDGFN
jgi:hypothetical protein